MRSSFDGKLFVLVYPSTQTLTQHAALILNLSLGNQVGKLVDDFLVQCDPSLSPFILPNRP